MFYFSFKLNKKIIILIPIDFNLIKNLNLRALFSSQELHRLQDVRSFVENYPRRPQPGIAGQPSSVVQQFHLLARSGLSVCL